MIRRISLILAVWIAASSSYSFGHGKKESAIKSKPIFRVDARWPRGRSEGRLRNDQPLRWIDLSENRLIGTLEGGFLTGPRKFWKDEKGNRPDSLSFNGIDQYVNFGDDYRTKLDRKFTIEIWLKPTGNGGSPNSGVILNREGEYEIGIAYPGLPANTVWFAVANQTPGWRLVNTQTSVAMDKWNQIVLSYDADKATDNFVFYLNGKQTFTATGAGPVGDYHPDMNALSLGGRQFLALEQYYQGDISMVRIFDRVLPSKEIKKRCERHEHRFNLRCK